MFPLRLNSRALLLMSVVCVLFSKILSLEAVFFYYVQYSRARPPANACGLILEGACVRLLGTAYKDQYVNLWHGGWGTEEKRKEDWGGRSDRKMMAVNGSRWQSGKRKDVETGGWGVVQGTSDLVLNGGLASCQAVAPQLCLFLG